MNDWQQMRPRRGRKSTDPVPSAVQEPKAAPPAAPGPVLERPAPVRPAVRPRPDLVLCPVCGGTGLVAAYRPVVWSTGTGGGCVTGGSPCGQDAYGQNACAACGGFGWQLSRPGFSIPTIDIPGVRPVPSWPRGAQIWC